MSLEEFHQFSARVENGQFLLIVTGVMIALLTGTLQRYLPLQRRPKLLPINMIGILLIAAVFRAPNLFDNLWYDETFTDAMAGVSLGKYLETLLADVHPPLAYLPNLLVQNIYPGSTVPEAVMRLPSYALGILTVFLVYQLVKSLKLRERDAQLASLLLALMPAHIFYSAEARGYSLLVVLVLLALSGIVRRNQSLFISAAGLIPLTHSIGYVYLAVLCMVAWLYNSASRRWFIVAATACLPAIAWLPGLYMQSRDVTDGFWVPPLTFQGIFVPLTSMTMTTHLIEFAIVPLHVAFSVLVAIAVAAALPRIRRWYLVAAIIVLPPLLLAIASFTWQPTYLHRALLPSMVLLVVPVAVGINRARLGTVWRGSLVVVLVMGIVMRVPKPNFSEKLSVCNGTDFVLATDISAGMIARRYAEPPVFMWTGAGDLNQELPDWAKENMGFDLVTHPEFELQGFRVCIYDWTTPMSGEHETRFVDYLASNFPTDVYRLEEEVMWTTDVYRIELWKQP